MAGKKWSRLSVLLTAQNKMSKPINQASKSVQNLNDKVQQMGKRRASFNQLAESNARLNQQVAQLTRQLGRANNQLAQLKSRADSARASIGRLGNIGAMMGSLYVGGLAGQGVGSVVENTVGTAMQQQYSKESVGILAGPKNGAQYWEQIQNYAASTAYSAEDWAAAMRTAIKNSKDINDLKKYQTVMEQLAVLDPVQGLEGAALAVRELNSGDIVSLVERFELPRQALKQIKDLPDPIKQVEELMVIIGDATGYTVDNIAKMKELPLMQWKKLTNSVKTMMGYVGQGALDVLAPSIENFNKMYDEGKFKPFVDAASKGFGQLTKDMMDFAVKGFEYLSSGKLQQKFQPFITLISKVRDTVKKAWPEISKILEDGFEIISQAATWVSDNWHHAEDAILKAIDVIEDFTDYVNKNFPEITRLVGSLLAGFLAYKALLKVSAWWTTFTAAVKAYRAAVVGATVAQTLLNVAMRLNPVTLLISAIAALATWFLTSGDNAQKFWNWLKKTWNWIKTTGISLGEQFGKTIQWMGDQFSGIIDWVKKAWREVEKFFEALKNTKINWDGFLPGGTPFIEVGSYTYEPESVGTPAALPAGYQAPHQMLANGGGFGPKHHGGIERVPYDNYPALLHKDERVQTAAEVKQEKRQQDRPVLITGNQFVVRSDKDIDLIAEALYNKLYNQKFAMGAGD